MLRECCKSSNDSSTELDTEEWSEPRIGVQQTQADYYEPFIKSWLQLFEKLHLEEASDDWREQLETPYSRAKPGYAYLQALLAALDSLHLQFAGVAEPSRTAYLDSVEQLAEAMVSACETLGWNVALVAEGHLLVIATLPVRQLALYLDAVRRLRTCEETERAAEVLFVAPLARRRLVGVPVARRGWPLADASCVVDMLRTRPEVSEEGDEEVEGVRSTMDNFRRTLSDAGRRGTSFIFLSVGVLYSEVSGASMSDGDVQRIAYFGKRLKSIGRVMHLCVPDAAVSDMVKLVIEKVRTLKAREVRPRDERQEAIPAECAPAADSSKPVVKRCVRVVLLGWEMGALLACYASLFEKIDGIVCIGLPVATVNRTRIVSANFAVSLTLHLTYIATPFFVAKFTLN